VANRGRFFVIQPTVGANRRSHHFALFVRPETGSTSAMGIFQQLSCLFSGRATHTNIGVPHSIAAFCD